MINFFEKFPEVLATMSERSDGSMKLFIGSDLNLLSRKVFFEKMGIYGKKIISAEIIHGNAVEAADEKSPEIILGVDALAAKDSNIFLTITIADCIPVFFYNPKEKIIAIAHCGWRGITAGVINSTVNKILQMGADAENTYIALGPGINQCHFEISKDVLDKFSNFSEFVIKREGKIFVDLKGIIKKQLDEFGIKPQNIEDNMECTMENSEKYFSFRRDKPEKVQAMVAVIGLK